MARSFKHPNHSQQYLATTTSNDFVDLRTIIVKGHKYYIISWILIFVWYMHAVYLSQHEIHQLTDTKECSNVTQISVPLHKRSPGTFSAGDACRNRSPTTETCPPARTHKSKASDTVKILKYIRGNVCKHTVTIVHSAKENLRAATRKGMEIDAIFPVHNTCRPN